MSTLKVTNIQNPSTSSGGVSIDTSGHVTIDGQVLPSAGALSNRNKIINGDMRIDQRNAGAAKTYGVGSAYALDRWKGAATIGNNMRVQQVTDAPAGFTNSLKADALTGATITASDYFTVSQSIEGFNISDLGFGTAAASSITLSFWVKSSITGTHSGSLRNSANDRSYPYTYTISSAETWEKKEIVIPGDTSGTWLTTNGVGIGVLFNLGAGSTFSGTAGAWAGANYLAATGAVSPLATSGATWYITGVQLEPGSVATPFEHRSYGDELARCQRYYQISISGFTGYAPNTTNAFGTFVPFIVLMRSAPTMTLIASLSAVNYSSAIGSFNSTRAEGYLYEKVPTAIGGARYTDSFAASAEL